MCYFSGSAEYVAIDQSYISHFRFVGDTSLEAAWIGKWFLSACTKDAIMKQLYSVFLLHADI
jgi:hypothetical protein